MSDMRKEVDYRLAKILCADMCTKNLIHSEEEKTRLTVPCLNNSHRLLRHWCRRYPYS